MKVALGSKEVEKIRKELVKMENHNEHASDSSEEITVREAGRRGGLATSSRYRGTGFYQRIGARGGDTTKRRWGHLFSEFGKRGGRPRRPNLEPSLGEESPQKKEDAVGPGDSSRP